MTKKRSKQKRRRKNAESIKKRVSNIIGSLFILQFFVYIFKQYILRFYRYIVYDEDDGIIDNDIKSSDINAGICGLTNLGNTCYMNSAIQCLSNTVPLRDYFIKNDYRKDINRKNPMGMNGNIAESFGNLLRQMWKTNKKCVSPKSLKNMISKWEPHFEGNDQHDSQELLSFLLDGLHEDLNCISINKPYGEINISDDSSDFESANESWKIHTFRNKSIIVDIFHGLLKSTITCIGCGKTSRTFDPFAYLSLPIVQEENNSKNHYIDLYDCLSLFSTNETLGKNDLWYCSKCETQMRVYKKLEIWKVPDILIIHLKRFNFNRRSRNKITDLIKFPIEGLDLDEYIINPKEKGYTYNLFAVSNHTGTLKGGHYTTFAKNSYSDDWFCFNDSHIKKVDDIKSIVTNSAYMLFYEKVK